MQWRATCLAALLLASLLAGCSQPKFYPTRGKVTNEAGPLPAGEVRFRPVSRPSHSTYALASSQLTPTTGC